MTAGRMNERWPLVGVGHALVIVLTNNYQADDTNSMSIPHSFPSWRSLAGKQMATPRPMLLQERQRQPKEGLARARQKQLTTPRSALHA